MGFLGTLMQQQNIFWKLWILINKWPKLNNKNDIQWMLNTQKKKVIQFFNIYSIFVSPYGQSVYTEPDQPLFLQQLVLDAYFQLQNCSKLDVELRNWKFEAKKNLVKKNAKYNFLYSPQVFYGHI